MAKQLSLEEIHAEALIEFEDIICGSWTERQLCMEDRRFCSIPGAQWEGGIGDQFTNTPMFEVNKVHLSVMRIINEYRNNRITVDFVPEDTDDPNSDKTADLCDGLYRSDERESSAEEAYDNAFEEGVQGGFGAWILRTKYKDDSDEDDDSQEVCIEPIFDADNRVYFDLNAKKQDKSDARRGFYITAMSHAAYKEDWGDDPVSWPVKSPLFTFDWCTPDVVYVANYFRVEDSIEKISVYRGLDGSEKKVSESDIELDDTLTSTLEATGYRLVREKKVKRKRVHEYIMSGGKILEDCGIIAGENIPIVPFYAKRWYINNIERCMGHVRLAKDPQRLKNMQTTALAMISASSSIKKPIFTHEQIAGNQQMWADDAVENYPYLLINALTNANGDTIPAGPIAYTETPDIPPAMAALLQMTEQDIQDLLGNQQAGEEMQPNLSGKAVELIQNRLDMQSFIYMSNFAKAVKRSGEIWLSMKRDLVVEAGQKEQTLSADGKSNTVKLMVDKYDPETGEVKTINDIRKGKFKVSVEVGPSSSSKRAATVRGLTGMMQLTQDPETQQVLSSMAMMNMEGEGITDVRDFFRRKLLRMGAVKPTEKEAQELAQEAKNAQPDANTQYLQAAAEGEKAKAVKARADTILTIAKSEETKANTASTLASIDISHRDQILRTATALGNAFQENNSGQNNGRTATAEPSYQRAMGQ